VSAAVATANIVLGLVFSLVGALGVIEMVRNRRAMGFSQFGAAWVALAFTCGPHHMVHGVHVAEGRAGGLLDLVAVLVGLPAGLAWFYLRVEALLGGRGDRYWRGNPLWVLALPTIGGIYVTALIAAAIGLGPLSLERLPAAAPNLLVIPIYCTIGFFLAKTQIANRRPLGGWSLSGLALAIVFPTCAAMHAVYALNILNGRYQADVHGLGVGWLAVLAGLYFLWVVQALYRGTFGDWNGSPTRARAMPAAPQSAAA
jgi:hypothetical protein